MTEAEVIEAKRTRMAARSVFDTQRDLVRADLDAASLGKRVANRLIEDGRYIAEEATDAAQRNKGLATAAALAVTALILRKPLLAFAGSIFGRASGDDDTCESVELHDEEPVAS